MSFKQFLTESMGKVWVIYDFTQGVGDDKSVIQLFASESSSVKYLKAYYEKEIKPQPFVKEIKYTADEYNNAKTLKSLYSCLAKQGIKLPYNYLYIEQHDIIK